jgi:hypothetical protein
VRANSHAALPAEDRSVEVFMYVAKFTEEQSQDKTARWQDKNLTSDEHVLKISETKQRIVDSLLSAVKAAAIDCHLDAGITDCYRPPANAQPDDLLRRFDMALEEDDSSSGKKLVQVVLIKKENRSYYWNTKTDEVYDYEMLNREGQRLVVGHVKKGKIIFSKK